MIRSLLLAGLLSLASLSAASAAFAQQSAYKPPRTPDGRPDLQGEWHYKWLSPVETSPLGRNLVVTEVQAKALVALARAAARALGEAALDPEAVDPDTHSLAIVKGEYRTRQIIDPTDGLLPYTPEAAKLVAARQVQFFQQVQGRLSDGPETRLTWERCLAAMGQAPLMTSWAIAMHRRTIQTPDSFVIWSESGSETRIVRINGKPRPKEMRSFLGDSIGRWEGDTLVVETTGFRKEDQFRLAVIGKPLMVGPDSKVVERFTRVSPTELNYQYTVIDPAIYAKPWLAEYSMMTTDEPTYEFACHEGNYSLPNILKGARRADLAKATAPVATTTPPSQPGKP